MPALATELRTDRELVDAFLEAIHGMSSYRIHGLIDGITQTDVSRWRRGEWKRLTGEKRRAIETYLDGAGAAPPGRSQTDLFVAVGEHLFTREGLYQTLSTYGGPGEEREKKLYLVQALHAIADKLQKEGLMPPMNLFADAYRDVLGGEI